MVNRGSSILINQLQSLAAKYLNIGREEISEFSVLTALGYSELSVKAVESCLDVGDINLLNEISDSGSTADIDTLIVCRCVAELQEEIFLLFRDSYELYQPTIVLRAIRSRH